MPTAHTGLKSFLVDAHGDHDPADRDLMKQHLEAGEFFWLDLYGPSDEDLAVLEDVFGFHSLAVEDAVHFGQRPKIDPYDQFTLLIAFGANEDRDGLVEVHCFSTERYLVTVHHDSCPSFEDLRQRAHRERKLPADGAMLLYMILDALADSYFPALTKLDDRIDTLENGVLRRPDEKQLQEVFRLKRRLVTWRKVITPQRDMLARLVTGAVSLPGMTDDLEHYYRDLYDHLIRISDLVDSYRDLLTGAMDVYLSTVSNRLNEVMKRLTIVATVFMPLTFIVGFFGMNFAWMIRQVTGFWPFFLLAVVTEIVVVIFLIVLFRRRGWM